MTDDLPGYMGLNTTEVVLINGVTVRITFELTAALDAPTGTFAATISYVIDAPGPDCERDFPLLITMVPALPPIADFSVERDTVLQGGALHFSDASVNAISDWSWDFGDGGTSSQRNPQHVFEQTGTFSVSLTVTGLAGSDTEVKNDLVTVVPEGTPGHQRWAFDALGIGIGGPIALGPDGTVYACSVDSSRNFGLFSLDPADGGVNWSFFEDGPCFSPVVVHPDGFVLVGSDPVAFFAIGTANGEKLWEFVPDGLIRGSPAIGPDGTIYAPTTGPNGRLYALGTDGEERWSFPMRAHGSPAVALDGTIYFLSQAGAEYLLIALSPAGEEKWTFFPGLFGGESPAIARDGTIIVPFDHSLFAVSPDGSERWRSLLGSDVGSPILGEDGTIHVVQGGGGFAGHELFSLDPTDGSVNWSHDPEVENPSASSPVPTIARDGTIYVGIGTKLFALTSDGTERWAFEIGGDSSIHAAPVVGASGSIFFGHGDGKVYAVSTTNCALAASAWPKSGQNNQNTSAASSVIFADGFECGDTSLWTPRP